MCTNLGSLLSGCFCTRVFIQKPTKKGKKPLAWKFNFAVRERYVDYVLSLNNNEFYRCAYMIHHHELETEYASGNTCPISI